MNQKNLRLINLEKIKINIMIKKNILFTFLFSTALYSQGNIEIISLQDAIDIALEKNINIKQSELNLKNSELSKSDAIVLDKFIFSNSLSSLFGTI